MQRSGEEVYRTLRQRLVGGYYQPGTQLKEEPLAQEFGVSRTPVRTVLRRLVDDGLATADAGQGIHVAQWSDWDVEENFQLRILLEPYAVALAVQRGGAELLKQLKAANKRMAAAVAKGGPQAVAELQAANSAFHHALLEHSGSARLRAMLGTMIDMPVVMRSFSLYADDERRQSLHHHEDLTRAVEAGNPELARQVMQLHLQSSHHRFMRHRQQMQG